ncbi:hypothetical protein ABZ863_09325 [Saccharomonospora sp. NPDC046836]|uniref:hypothetical protein n=1 Tax=Saccharomonospora sp. NPDC046836 TaxID=3156921 RepID=UPI0033CF257A
MAATLPVPIEFSLPEGWRAAPPDEVGAPGVAFAALAPGQVEGFIGNITISGDYRDDHADLPAIADESVDRLERSAVVHVADRTLVGTEQAPGLTQRLDIATTVNGNPVDLVQCQVYLELRDVAEPRRRVIVELALTSTRGDFGGLVGDFQEFVRGIRTPEGEQRDEQQTDQPREPQPRPAPRHTRASGENS